MLHHALESRQRGARQAAEGVPVEVDERVVCDDELMPGAAQRIGSVQIRGRIAAVGKEGHRWPVGKQPVNRANTVTWSRHFAVFELASPAGRVYVMQSFSQIVDKTLTLSKLRTLGSRLKLPPGWHFRRGRLAHHLTLTTTGRATVMQDERQDTYQLVTR
jgi:hypothetical protein